MMKAGDILIRSRSFVFVSYDKKQGAILRDKLTKELILVSKETLDAEFTCYPQDFEEKGGLIREELPKPTGA
jgi:hypothetical protein